MENQWIPFHLPEIGEKEIQAVLEVLKSRWITTGPKVQTFEKAFAHYIGTSHAVAVNSCTAALHLGLDALGLKEGDEVILPTMTFAACAEVVQYFKALPVLVDSLPDTLHMDPEDVERKITPKTRAIMAVHYGGLPCDLEELTYLAKQNNLALIEDAAHALPAFYKGKKIGTWGDITCFSFYATKTLTTGEGGMATTENPQWAKRMQVMRLHGMDQDAWKRYSHEGRWYYSIVDAGFKYNMTDIQAALGLAQLEQVEAFFQRRKTIAQAYTALLKDCPLLELPEEKEDRTHAWHLYVVKLKKEQLSISRNQVIQKLKEHNIGTSVHFIPLHKHPHYQKAFHTKDEDYPIATDLYERILSLPIYPSLTDAQINTIASTLRDILEENQR